MECVILTYDSPLARKGAEGPLLRSFILYLFAQDQSLVIHIGTRVRVRTGPAAGGHRTQVGNRRSSCACVESCCGIADANAGSACKYGLNAGNSYGRDKWRGLVDCTNSRRTVLEDIYRRDRPCRSAWYGA